MLCIKKKGIVKKLTTPNDYYNQSINVDYLRSNVTFSFSNGHIYNNPEVLCKPHP